MEISEFCQAVIRARQGDGLIPQVPIFSDVRTFDAVQLSVAPEAMVAGFPCTVSCHSIDVLLSTNFFALLICSKPPWRSKGISRSGLKKGLLDIDRSGLIRDVFRVLDTANLCAPALHVNANSLIRPEPSGPFFASGLPGKRAI